MTTADTCPTDKQVREDFLRRLQLASDAALARAPAARDVVEAALQDLVDDADSEEAPVRLEAVVTAAQRATTAADVALDIAGRFEVERSSRP